MPQCSIRWCGKSSSESNMEKDGITFHLYPQDGNVKEKWINATRRDNWMPSKYSVICSRHFAEDCFIYMKNRRRLLRTSIPTLYLPILSTGESQDGASTSNLPTTSSNGENCPGTPSQCESANRNRLRRRSTEESQDEASTSYLPTTSSNRENFPGSPSQYNSPNEKRLCRKVIDLTYKVAVKNKQLKILRDKTRYLQKRIASLNTVINELQNKKLTDSNDADLQSKIVVTSKKLVKRQISKTTKHKFTQN